MVRIKLLLKYIILKMMMLKTLLKKTTIQPAASLLRLTQVPASQPMLSASLRFLSTQPPAEGVEGKPEAVKAEVASEDKSA